MKRRYWVIKDIAETSPNLRYYNESEGLWQATPYFYTDEQLAIRIKGAWHRRPARIVVEVIELTSVDLAAIRLTGDLP